MEKRKLHVIIKSTDENYEYITIGTLEDNKIIYKENNKIITDVTYDLDKKNLYRENKDAIVNLSFKEEIGYIFLKDIEKQIDLVLKVKEYIDNNHKLEVNYEIENNDFHYEINY